MILVGLKIKWSNCVGAIDIHNLFFECNDYHEAATETLKCNWSNSWQGQYVTSGEFHDTVSKNTWSVDSGGHTKKDYRKEKDNDFMKRWKSEER